MLEKGMTLSMEHVVKENETAAKVASGALEVFSTPLMIGFMENVAFSLAEKELNEGETTVGVSVNIKHLRANLVGDKLKCTAVLENIEGKRLDFDVKVCFGDIVVGEGKHSRFIVNTEKFLSKLR